jgi:hypothetical protein
MSGSVPVYYTDEYSAYSTQSWLHDVNNRLNLPEPPPGQHWAWFPHDNIDLRSGTWSLELDGEIGNGGLVVPRPDTPSLTFDSDIHLPNTANLEVIHEHNPEYLIYTAYENRNVNMTELTDVVRINHDAGRTVFAGTELFVTPPAPTGFALPIRPPLRGYMYAFDIRTNNWTQVVFPTWLPPRGQRFVLANGMWFLVDLP